MKKDSTAKFETFESCRSCQHHYKDKLNHVRMCNRHQTIDTKTHVNQNGHVRKEATSVIGHAPCSAIARGANKCKGYKRNNRKPLQVREVA